jgi:hypothetical protein
MLKNLTTNQLMMITLAAVLLLIAAFSFYLLQNPTAPLPFVPPPATSTSTHLFSAEDATAVPLTPTPTRRTSYTPLFAFETPTLATPSAPPVETGTPSPPPALTDTPAAPTTQSIYPGPNTVQPSLPYPNPPQPSPSATQQYTGTPPTGTVSPSPTATTTLAAGEIRLTGRVVKNGTPMPNVVVSFADDTAARKSTTDAGGHYTFVTLAPGTNFLLTFKQSDNSSLTPISEIASFIKLEGTLPTNANPIDFPDLEISINLSGMIFQLISPVGGSAYSASAISATNPLQFTWSLYSQGGSYSAELGPHGVDQPTWLSSQLASTSTMWNGTLIDGTHITSGNYWWRVGVTKSLGSHVVVIYTQPLDISFNP